MIKLWFPVNEEIAHRNGNVSIKLIVFYIYVFIKFKIKKVKYLRITYILIFYKT